MPVARAARRGGTAAGTDATQHSRSRWTAWHRSRNRATPWPQCWWGVGRGHVSDIGNASERDTHGGHRPGRSEATDQQGQKVDFVVSSGLAKSSRL